jgi:four helix bundle protein
MDFTVATYRAVSGTPKPEMRALVDQMRRSAASVPANIAEGYGRESARSYIQFLKIARGSLNEAETPVLLAERLEFLSPEQAKSLLGSSEAISKMLNGLIKSISASDRQATSS